MVFFLTSHRLFQSYFIMKTYSFLVLLLFFLFLSCKPIDKQSKTATNENTADTIADTSSIRIIKEYFSNGKVKTEIEAKGNLRHGLTRNYDRFGRLISDVTYVRNVREGKATNYYAESGKVNSTLIYKNGIKEGDEIWYYESGKPYRVTPYINGRANGIQKFYYENGILKAEIPMKNGNPGTGLKEFNNDGTLIKNYPKLNIRQKDYISNANKVILTIELSEPDQQFKLYRGPLEDGKYFRSGLLLLAMQNGIAQIDFNVPPGSALSQNVVITANVKTKFGNPLILTRTFHVYAVNNN
jgi:antitoxin component YwqK of YwqJK toxin-antitoxin module